MSAKDSSRRPADPHAGLLLHVRHQVQHGEPQFGVHLSPHVGDVSGPAYSTAHVLAALGRVARPSALRWHHGRADAHPA
ncbi:hypothetical protein CAI18_23585 (plasmid) [Xanthomonas citri pv. punicae]|nr:hypothetical protein XacyCFBP1159_21130 [Xanthomonas arboricola pv. corylina]QCZ67317.1 hypothetical protein CAI14_23300 [Xanthomonas citri pv. punicae]RFF44866.1 hypothetical protein D0A38_11065 [Xanthomonas campestris pv. incanae]QCZ67340.1 hypothetical protein CAI14_23490 [Xanthomonas citri pv. punicae]QCZ71390.1 hypothetical protein CAI17_23145 [Xanthomonas citri pv. punicae]